MFLSQFQRHNYLHFEISTSCQRKSALCLDQISLLIDSALEVLHYVRICTLHFHHIGGVCHSLEVCIIHWGCASFIGGVHHSLYFDVFTRVHMMPPQIPSHVFTSLIDSFCSVSSISTSGVNTSFMRALVFLPGYSQFLPHWPLAIPNTNQQMFLIYSDPLSLFKQWYVRPLEKQELAWTYKGPWMQQRTISQQQKLAQLFVE